MTTAYRFHYEDARRVMWLDAIGDPWTPAQAVAAAGDAEWVNVCALTRTDFSSETLAALAAGGRRLLVDAQGLVRTPTIGSLHTDGDVGDLLRHVEILKLDEEEAEALVGGSDPERLRMLGVPEILLTLGPRGSFVVTPELVEHVPAVEVAGSVDPTGAGDTFSMAFLVERAAGAELVDSARAAAAAASASLARP